MSAHPSTPTSGCFPLVITSTQKAFCSELDSARPQEEAPILVHRPRYLWHMGFSTCGSWAQLPHNIWDLPGTGIKPASPALQGRSLTTETPGKPWNNVLLKMVLSSRCVILVSRFKVSIPNPFIPFPYSEHHYHGNRKPSYYNNHSDGCFLGYHMYRTIPLRLQRRNPCSPQILKLSVREAQKII